EGGREVPERLVESGSKRIFSVAVAAAVLIGCGNAERGRSCFSGSCPLPDGGSFAFGEVCLQAYQCYLPDEAVDAGLETCRQYGATIDAGCSGPSTDCTARFVSRPDWEDCYK